MSPLARVTVIIPVFNRRDELARALESLVAQTVKDFVVVICDDGSTDRPDEVVDRFSSRLSVELRRQSNSGLPASARNLGLSRVETEYVAFLDSDDWWGPTKLECSLNVLDRGWDVVFHDLKRVEQTGRVSRFRRIRSRRLGAEPYSSLIHRGNAVPTSSVVFRSSLVGAVGLMSEDVGVRSWEDFDYWIRMSQITTRFKRIRGSFGFYAISSDSVSGVVGLARNLTAMQLRLFPEVERLPAWVHFGFGLADFRAKRFGEARGHLLRSIFFHGLPRVWTDVPKACALFIFSCLPSSRFGRTESR